VTFVDGAEIQELFMVGDTFNSQVNKKVDILGALMMLVPIYYIFDLEYPRPYSMLLAMVQTRVMEEPYKDTSKGFNSFSKSLDCPDVLIILKKPASVSSFYQRYKLCVSMLSN